jgi:hypothetical protein
MGARANLDAVNAHAREEMMLKKRQCLLEEFKANIWNAAEYRERLEQIEAEGSSEHRGPTKKARYQSPGWDLFASSADEFDGGSL